MLDDGTVAPLTEEHIRATINAMHLELDTGKYGIENKNFEAVIAFLRACGGIAPRMLAAA